MRPLGSSTGAVPKIELTVRERELMALTGEQPKPVRRVAVSSGAQRSLAALDLRRLVQIGRPSSDAAHVLGLQDNWSREAAVKAALLAVRMRSLKADRGRCPGPVRGSVVGNGAAVGQGAARYGDWPGASARWAHLLIDAASRGRRRVGLAEVRLKPGVAVAVGGPVKVYHPEAAWRLGCEIIFSDHWAVANAVGAAAGVVARTVTIAITGDGAGSFRVHLPEGVMPMTTAREALALAEAEARRLAGAAALAMGATMVDACRSGAISLLPDAIDDNGLFDGQVTAEAIGRPL